MTLVIAINHSIESRHFQMTFFINSHFKYWHQRNGILLQNPYKHFDAIFELLKGFTELN